MSCEQKLLSGAEKFGIELTEVQVNQFKDYLNLLQKWNQKINLTAVDSPEEIIVKHFLDSLSLAAELDISGAEKVIDVGTGAGFPGLPLKIIYPEFELTLLEAVKKKTTFLRQVVYKLNLKEVEVIHGRAEDIGMQEDHRERYDIGLARAVAELNILGEYVLPFIKPSGKFIAYKGRDIEPEVEASRQAVERLGGKISLVKTVDLPFSTADRSLVVIDKKDSTSLEYPRSAGIPEKRPLN